VVGDQRRLYQSPPLVAHASVVGATSAVPAKGGARLIDWACANVAGAQIARSAVAANAAGSERQNVALA